MAERRDVVAITCASSEIEEAHGPLDIWVGR
jgi:hypothetical protein